jgi:hypothetical protein
MPPSSMPLWSMPLWSMPPWSVPPYATVVGAAVLAVSARSTILRQLTTGSSSEGSEVHRLPWPFPQSWPSSRAPGRIFWGLFGTDPESPGSMIARNSSGRSLDGSINRS